MTTAEAIFSVIVIVISLLWDALIVYQIWRGETFAFSPQKWEPPPPRSRKTEPGAFWTAIVLQAIFPNGAILYLLFFAISSLS